MVVRIFFLEHTIIVFLPTLLDSLKDVFRWMYILKDQKENATVKSPRDKKTILKCQARKGTTIRAHFYVTAVQFLQ